MHEDGFTADAAHELRTPVAVLKAHAGILSKFDGHAELLDEIGSLERLVNQLLDIAPVSTSCSSMRKKWRSLTSIATEVASHLAPAAIGARRSIEVVAPDEPVHIRGARDYLFRALRNLVENALRYTPEGTTVSIQIAADPPRLALSIRGPGCRRDSGMRSFVASGRAAAIRNSAAQAWDWISRPDP